MKDEIPTAKFKILLSRLIEEKLLSDEAVEIAYRYLFLKEGHMPFFTLTELYDTTNYLKDLMETNHLATLDDLLDYYQRKRRSIRAYIDAIVVEKPKGPEFVPESLPESWTKSVDEEEPVQGLSIDQGEGDSPSAHQSMCLLPMHIDQSCVISGPCPKGTNRPLENAKPLKINK